MLWYGVSVHRKILVCICHRENMYFVHALTSTFKRCWDTNRVESVSLPAGLRLQFCHWILWPQDLVHFYLRVFTSGGSSSYSAQSMVSPSNTNFLNEWMIERHVFLWVGAHSCVLGILHPAPHRLLYLARCASPKRDLDFLEVISSKYVHW